jgi:hypothetical protein
VPVDTVTVCAPAAALEAMLMTAVALVAELTVTDATVIPVPNEAVGRTNSSLHVELWRQHHRLGRQADPHLQRGWNLHSLADCNR